MSNINIELLAALIGNQCFIDNKELSIDAHRKIISSATSAMKKLNIKLIKSE